MPVTSKHKRWTNAKFYTQQNSFLSNSLIWLGYHKELVKNNLNLLISKDLIIVAKL